MTAFGMTRMVSMAASVEARRPPGRHRDKPRRGRTAIPPARAAADDRRHDPEHRAASAPRGPRARAEQTTREAFRIDKCASIGRTETSVASVAAGQQRHEEGAPIGALVPGTLRKRGWGRDVATVYRRGSRGRRRSHRANGNQASAHEARFDRSRGALEATPGRRPRDELQRVGETVERSTTRSERRRRPQRRAGNCGSGARRARRSACERMRFPAIATVERRSRPAFTSAE